MLLSTKASVALCLFFILTPLIASSAETSADSLYSEARSALATGDTTSAVSLLDRTLQNAPRPWEALLLRGQLRLAAGNRKAARWDFTQALNSKSDEIRYRARIGLGNVLASLPNRNLDAIKQYRIAIKIDPDNQEAYHNAAHAALAMGTLEGYSIASGLLLDLTCLDPTYKNACETWRDTILDKKKDELLLASRCLESFIDGHPEYNCWLLDAARYRYQADEVEAALSTLDRLESADPSHKPAERNLLRARCLLDLGDTLGFETFYDQAINAAENDGDFNRLITEAETIFTPGEENSIQQLKTPGQLAAFFRVFWRNKDPDPVTFHNERLVTHYLRLRTAEKQYKVFTQYNLKQNSDSYLRLMSIPEKTTMDFKPDVDNKDGALYDYDPVRVFGGKGSKLGLDHQGLIYIRHGPPSYIDYELTRGMKDGFTGGSDMGSFNTEVWVYWPNKIYFKLGLGTGDYLFYASMDESVADIEHAMQSQTFEDPLPAEEQDFYSAVFLREDGLLDLEFYQSIPASVSKAKEPPQARLALYDRSLTELKRDSTETRKTGSPDDSIWIAVNSIPVAPENYSYALSFALPDVRAVVKNNIRIEPLTGKQLELSGIILGSPPDLAPHFYQRMNVPVLPRPSRSFSLNEIITVYFEIYGLDHDENGRRSFRNIVTVSIVEERKSLLKAVFSKNKKLSGSLILSFDRNYEVTKGPVAEHFTIDTSQLVPGAYGLKCEIIDTNTGQKRQVSSFFELE